MKQKHILFFLGSILFLTEKTQAFPTNQDIVSTAPVLTIEKTDNTIELTYEYSLFNQTEEPLSYQIIYPLITGTNNPRLFVDSDGVTTDTMSGNQKIETLWTISQENNNPFFLRWGHSIVPSILVSSVQTVQGRESKDIKYQYNINTKTIQNWQWIKGFFPPSKSSTEIKISSPNNEWMLSNIKNLQNISPFQHENTHFIETNIQNASEIILGWSKTPSPLKQGSIGHTYALEPTTPEYFQPEKITILLDTSGSITAQQWQKTSETVRFFLNEILQNKQIQVGLFDQEIEWLVRDENNSPEYQPNTVTLRQSIFETIDATRPLGKTNLTAILENEIITNQAEEKEGFILITDETYANQTLPPYTALFHLGNEQERSSWSENTAPSSSWIFGLLSAQTALLESKDLKNLWETWYTIAPPPESNLEDQHFLPNAHHTTVPAQTLGRLFEPTATHPWLQWIPQSWAQKQIDRISNKEDKKQSDLDAIESIKTVFGLQPNPKFVDQEPSYEQEGTWEVYNFQQQQNPNTTITIAPFSEAAEYLYKNNTDLVSEGMSNGLMSNFCTQKRCIQINPKGQNEITPFILAYWNEKDDSHWALPYVQPMVKNDEYPIKDNGDLGLEEPISRGDFIQMMYDRIPTYRWRKGSPLTFEDLPEDNPYFEAISWFSEHKIITGYEDKTVQPDRPLSRAEAVKIMLSTDGYKPSEAENPVFKDSTTWEKSWVNEAHRRGYVRGFSQTHFKPHAGLTKGQAAKLITKFFE